VTVFVGDGAYDEEAWMLVWLGRRSGASMSGYGERA